tara:strand:+ start:535 stop:1224 length:690 start_codon:yes stop_codon:yes gene_type:complete
MQDTFWLNDPTILFNKDSVGQVWPAPAMSTNEKLNAITRLVILLTILGYLVTGNFRVIITGVVTIIAVALLKYLKRDDDIKQNIKNAAKEGFATLDRETLAKMRMETPTADNPMMNVLLPQIQDNPNRPAAAPAFNPVIVEDINKKTQEMVVNNFDDKKGIDERLFKDLGDSFQFDRSMIQFNATANTTIPNDQKSFAEFCYGDMISCKEGNEIACTQSMPPHWINGTN